MAQVRGDFPSRMAQLNADLIKPAKQLVQKYAFLFGKNKKYQKVPNKIH
jgi:hypothetical protein